MEGAEERSVIDQLPGSFFLALLLCIIAFVIAKRRGFFRLSLPPVSQPIRFRQLLGAFSIYLSLAFLLLPLLSSVGALLFLEKGEVIPREWLGWAQVISLWIIFACLVGYLFLIRKETRGLILWGNQVASWRLWLKSIGLGAVTWLISYPFVLLTNLIATAISYLIWKVATVEQVAVKQLKLSKEHPILFVLMVLAVFLVVPFLEELLFRGFLQSYLRKVWGRYWSLFSTAAIFALVHFAPSQGEGNFQLILSLFTLSLFLGFLYERQKTIWAPFALHAIFNGVSALWITIA